MFVKDYNYNGTIALEISYSKIILEEGESFGIPLNNSRGVIATGQSEHYKSILDTNKLNWIYKLFKVKNKLVERNTKYIQGKRISGVYAFEDDYSSNA